MAAGDDGDGEPELILQMPDNTLAPASLAAGLAILFAAALAHLWWLAAVGLAIWGVSLAVWFWPRRIRGPAPEPIDG